MKKTYGLIVFLLFFSFLFSSCGTGGTQQFPNMWTWVSGSNTVDQYGIYTDPTPGNNVPGARALSVSWIDKSGNLWLFGGSGYPSSGKEDLLNDLWKFDGTNWTFVSGSNLINQPGSYVTNKVPGGRCGAVSWIDKSGNLWLFGGEGYDSSGKEDLLNDLWKFDVTNSTWTWISGSNIVDQYGSYGTKGVTDPTPGKNVPGARNGAVSWIDKSGNLWLFGGWGYASKDYDVLNDLWKFDVTHSTWTWMSGSDSVNQNGIYNDPIPGNNVPGTRQSAVSWIDKSGNLWLFGGVGYDSMGINDLLNDLWKFDGTNWTWVSGSNLVDKSGIYNDPTPGKNVPGARYNSVTWIGGSGNLWLFGGAGYDSMGNKAYLNDLWKFDGTNWTWVSGSNTVDHYGSYGTLGVTGPSNMPGTRNNAVSWIDKSGNLWLFGGLGYASMSGPDLLNDLWVYKP